MDNLKNHITFQYLSNLALVLSCNLFDTKENAKLHQPVRPVVFSAEENKC